MRHALIIAGFAFGAVLFAPSVHAQSAGGIRGKVVDQDGQPLADVTITIESTTISRKVKVKTNEKGEYLRIGLRHGQYRVVASKEGYQATYVPVDVHLGDAVEAPQLQLQKLQTGPSEAELRAMFGEAVELAGAGQLDEAEAAFLKLIGIQSNIPVLHVNLGYVYVQKEDWERAEACYRTALELSPGDPNALVALAQVYRDTGREDEAMALLDRAASENPEDLTIKYQRGVYLIGSGKAAEAREVFEAVLAADPSMAEAHYYLGTIMVGTRETAEEIMTRLHEGADFAYLRNQYARPGHDAIETDKWVSPAIFSDEIRDELIAGGLAVIAIERAFEIPMGEVAMRPLMGVGRKTATRGGWTSA